MVIPTLPRLHDYALLVRQIKVQSGLIPLRVTSSNVLSGKQRKNLASRLAHRPASSKDVGKHSKRRPTYNTRAPMHHPACKQLITKIFVQASAAGGG